MQVTDRGFALASTGAANHTKRGEKGGLSQCALADIVIGALGIRSCVWHVCDTTLVVAVCTCHVEDTNQYLRANIL